MKQDDLTQPETHFAFGKNWAFCAEKMTDKNIEEAANGFMWLIGEAQLDGLHFLGIRSGSVCDQYIDQRLA